MKIPLQVPAKPKAEFASVGNFEAELKPNSTIEVESRTFADYLISEFDLKEIGASGNTSNSGDNPQPLEAEYPADFPKRKVFIGLNMPFETARNLDREQLIAVNRINDKSADAILAWQPAPPAPVVPVAPAKPGDAADETSDETNEGGQE